jgi:hypothetical protein
LIKDVPVLKNISFFSLLVYVPCFGLAPHIDYKKAAAKNKAGQAETLAQCVARGTLATDAEYLAQLQRCARMHLPELGIPIRDFAIAGAQK